MLKFPRGLRREDPNAERDDVQKLKSRFGYLLNLQRIYAVEWQEISDYVLPRKNSIITRRVPGSKRTQRLFDSAPLDARDKLASAIHGSLTSSYQRWFYDETEDDELNRDQGTAIWCDAVGLLGLADLARSNFNGEAGELYTDLVTFASSAMFAETMEIEHPGIFEGVRFKTEMIGRSCWAEGADGHVDTLFRELNMSRAAISEKWPDTPAEILQKGAADDEQLSVIHAVVPETGRPKTWRSVYILTNADYKLSEKGFARFPFFCPRWSKGSGEIYGRGPTHEALPDIRTLNKVREMSLRALPKIIDPPLVGVSGDVIGPPRLVPGGVTYTRGSVDSLKPLMTGIDVRAAGLVVDDLRNSIRAIYHEAELQLPNGPQMTAEEVRARREQMMLLLGPIVYGNIEKEFLHPLIDFLFDARLKAKALPPLPPAMQIALQRKKIVLRVRYDGPIARAQRASDVDATKQLLGVAQLIAPVDPAALDVIDFDAMLRSAGRKYGVDPIIIRDEQGVDQVRKVKADQAAQQQQQAAAAQAAQSAGAAAPALKALAKKPDPGSPLANMPMGGPPQNAAG